MSNSKNPTPAGYGIAAAPVFMLTPDTSGQFQTINSPDTSTAVTIAAGGSLSGQVDLAGLTLVGLLFPAAWTAAALSFTASPSLGGTDYPLFDGPAGTEITVPSAAIATSAVTWVRLDPNQFIGLRFLKLLSGTHASPVNQTAGATITLVARQL